MFDDPDKVPPLPALVKGPFTAIAAPALPAPSMPKELGEVQLSKLAHEVAMDIRDLDIVLVDYNINADQYKVLLTTPYYKRALEVALQEWNGALSTHQRIKIKSAALLEQNLIGLATRMGQNAEALPAVVEAGKLLKSLAGIQDNDKPMGTGEKFSITINLGADEKLTFEKDVTPTTETPVTIEASKGDTNEK